MEFSFRSNNFKYLMQAFIFSDSNHSISAGFSAVNFCSHPHLSFERIGRPPGNEIPLFFCLIPQEYSF